MVTDGTKLAYKAGELVKVSAPHISQTYGCCGPADPRNRTSRVRFCCVMYGFTANADHNAAVNILGLHGASVPIRGTGAAARRGALPPCSSAGWQGHSRDREQGGWGPSP